MSLQRAVFIAFSVTITVGCTDDSAPTIDDSAQGIRDGLWVQPGKGAVPRIAFVRDDKYGFLDATGRVSIEPQYRWSDDFLGGFALCEWKGQGTIIDESGSVVGVVRVPVETYFRADVERVWYRVDDKWGLCNLHGETLVEPLYDDVDRFSDSMARVNIGAELDFTGLWEGGKNGYINIKGEPNIACQFEEYCWGFHEGYAVVGDSLINRDGEVQFSRPGLGFVFAEGLINISSFGRDPRTDYVDSKGRIKLTVEGDGEKFSEGLAVISNKNGAGYVDISGKYVIQPRFRRAQPFSSGLAGVSLDEGRWGYVDRNGRLVTPTHFNEVRPAEMEFAIVHYGGAMPEEDGLSWEDGRWLMIDRSGRPLAVISEDQPSP